MWLAKVLSEDLLLATFCFYRDMKYRLFYTGNRLWLEQPRGVLSHVTAVFVQVTP